MRKRKLLYLICVIGLIFTNALYLNYEMTVTLILVLLIPVITWLFYFLVMIGLKVHLYTKYLQVHKSNEIRLYTNIVNACPVPVSRGRLEVFLEYSCDSDIEEMVIPISVKAYEDSDPITIQPKHCGILRINIGRFIWNDYTGIFQSCRKLQGVINMTVLPDLLIPEDKQLKQSTKTCQQMYSESDISEVKEIRRYEPGDALNRIHWKLSLKEDELMVKEFEQLPQKDHVILVDLSKQYGADYRDKLDLIYQFAYSYGNYVNSVHVPYAFVVWNHELRILEEISFHDEETLSQAIKRLMSIPCSQNAMKYMEQALNETDEYDLTRSILITTQKYKNTRLCMVQITKDNIQKKLNEVCK